MKYRSVCLPALLVCAVASIGACSGKGATDTGTAGSAGAGTAGSAGTSGVGGDAGAGGNAGTSGVGGGAGTSGDGSAGSGGSGGMATPVNVGTPLSVITANPLVSRGKPAFASAGNASYINDGKYSNQGQLTWQVASSAISAATPAWVAIQVGKGPSKLLLSWNAGSNYNYGANGSLGQVPLAAPDSYSIETSPDSSNGADGVWTAATIKVADASHVLQDATSVTGNDVRTRGHSFAFPADAEWVRLSVTKVTGTSTVLALDEIDVHDVSNGSDDTWVFLGDSITAFAYDRDTADQPSFAEVVHAKHAGYFPAMINAGIGSELSVDGNGRLQKVIDLNPDYHFIALGYGTNDSWGTGKDPSAFTVTMQTMIDSIKAAGKVPVLARIPYSPDLSAHSAIPAFNTALDGLTTKASNMLSTEADLYTFFLNNPQDLQSDKVHPKPAGRIGMNQAWADACDSAYAP